MNDDKWFALAPHAAAAAAAEAPRAPEGRTVRLRFALPESNEDTYPEFNYKEELAAATKKDKTKSSSSSTNGLDPFNDEDDDVRRIAQEMEAKYGVSAPKRRKKGRRDDYADIGMGYDESDSFIDNTDGYDEMIPHNVTTVLGGFYINSGELEFKAVEDGSSDPSSSSSSDDEDDKSPKTNGVKRILSSDSEGEKETEPDSEPSEKRLKFEGNQPPRPPARKVFSLEKINELKKRKEEKKKTSTVKELLKEKRNEVTDGLVPPKLEKTAATEESKDSMKENEQPLSDSIANVIEAVVKSVDDNLQNRNVELKNPPISEVELIPNDAGNGDGSEFQENIVQLPENLPDKIVEIVEKIKELATKRTEGKIKFFSGPVSDLLLRLESSCKCLGKHSRLRVYEHLAPFVRLKKETLIKRAKNLVLEEEQRKLKGLIDRLKRDIDVIMPDLLLNYERESQKVLQKKFSTNEDNRQIRMPKRRFMWTEEMRRSVKDIANIRKKCFILEGIHKNNLDELLIDYLKSNVQTLWPDGWMSMTVLRKICSGILSFEQKPQETHNNPEISTSKELQMLSANSNLSITPIIATTSKSGSEVPIPKTDVTINKIDNHVAAEIVKCSTAALTITPTSLNLKQHATEKEPNAITAKSKPEDFIVIEESLPRKLDFGKKESHRPELPQIKTETCQIIDLTDQRKSQQKPKPQINLNDIFSTKQLQGAIPKVEIKSEFKSEFSRPKSAEGDDIQKVMEDLKVLQKMSSPVKAGGESLTSSPVSVIAYNKSYSPKNTMGGHASTSQRADFGTAGYPDAYSRISGDFSLLSTANHSTPAVSKSHYTSAEKYVHSSSPVFLNDKYHQGVNNNFPSNSSKLNNLPQQTGHLSKQPQK